MYTIDSVNRENISSVLLSSSEKYDGPDSWVYHFNKVAIHWYKSHVNIDIFQLYLAATENVSNLLNGLVNIPTSGECVEVLVNPILSWFIEAGGAVISVCEWIDGSKGVDLKHNNDKKKYLEILNPMNEKLFRNGSPMGIEIVPLNTRFRFPIWSNAVCTITDVGNNLKFLKNAR